MSKDREPYICDAPGCGKRRSSDANHWWLVRPLLPNGIGIAAWDARNAELPDVKHCCGIDCMTKVVASLAAAIVDARSAGKEPGSGA